LICSEPKVFAVAEGCEFGSDFGRGEEELEGFSGELDARGERVVGELFEERKCGAGLAIVEDDTAAGRQSSDEVMVKRKASR